MFPYSQTLSGGRLPELQLLVVCGFCSSFTNTDNLLNVIHVTESMHLKMTGGEISLGDCKQK